MPSQSFPVNHLRNYFWRKKATEGFMLKMSNLRGLIDIRVLWGRHNLALTHFVNEMCILRQVDFQDEISSVSRDKTDISGFRIKRICCLRSGQFGSTAQRGKHDNNNNNNNNNNNSNINNNNKLLFI